MTLTIFYHAIFWLITIYICFFIGDKIVVYNYKRFYNGLFLFTIVAVCVVVTTVYNAVSVISILIEI